MLIDKSSLLESVYSEFWEIVKDFPFSCDTEKDSKQTKYDKRQEKFYLICFVSVPKAAAKFYKNTSYEIKRFHSIDDWMGDGFRVLSTIIKEYKSRFDKQTEKTNIIGDNDANKTNPKNEPIPIDEIINKRLYQRLTSELKDLINQFNPDPTYKLLKKIKSWKGRIFKEEGRTPTDAEVRKRFPEYGDRERDLLLFQKINEWRRLCIKQHRESPTDEEVRAKFPELGEREIADLAISNMNLLERNAGDINPDEHEHAMHSGEVARKTSSGLIDISNPILNTAEVVLRAESIYNLRVCIQEQSPLIQSYIDEYYFKGHSMHELEEIFHETEARVKRYIKNAEKDLRSCLKKKYGLFAKVSDVLEI